MKYIIYFGLALFSPMIVFCQDITGLWQGSMYNDSTKQTLEYEIKIIKKNGKYTGFSHTWFVIDDKRYYGIKKIDVRVAKDGKIVIQDAKLLEENYPIPSNKKTIQLNVLDLTGAGNEAALNGLFVTNSTRDHKALTGQVKITRVDPQSQSNLVQFINKGNLENNLTIAKAEK